jgi:hypothetical protein
MVGKGMGVERMWWWQKTGVRVVGMKECLGRLDYGFDLPHVKEDRVMEWQGELGDGVGMEEVLDMIEAEGL